MIVLTPISVGAFGAVVWWMVRSRAETDSAERIDRIWQQRNSWGEETCRLLIERQVEAGMTPEMVRLAWGEPAAVETTSAGLERWQYNNSGYALFEAGQVIEAERATPARKLVWGPWPIIAILLGLSTLVSIIALGVVFFS